MDSIWIQASAGSGKTYHLTKHYLDLIKSGYDPNSILCITFTNSAADEMKRRINGKHIQTLHSFCCYLIDRNNVIDNIVKLDVLDRSLEEAIKDKDYLCLFKGLLQSLTINKIKTYIRTRTITSCTDNILLLSLDKLYKKVWQIYKNKNEMDYDDIIDNAFDLLNSNSGEIYHKLCNIKHILIDESQDLSESQWKVIYSICEEIINIQGSISLFVVGDSKQSIYTDDSDLMNKYYGELKKLLFQHSIFLRKKHLTTSYRSNQTILDFVNNVFLDENFFVEKDFPTHKSFLQFDEGDKVFLKKTDNIPKEISRDITSLLNKGYKSKDIMVLIKSRNRLSREIENELYKKNIQYNSAQKLYLIDKIMPLIISIKYCNSNNYEEIRFYVIYMLQAYFNIDITKLSRDHDTSNRTNISKFVMVINKSDFDIKTFNKINDFFRLIENSYNSDSMIGSIVKLCSILKIKNSYVDHIIKIYSKYIDLKSEFIEILISNAKNTVIEKGIMKDTINISTIHGSKGQEAKVVLLADTNFPNNISNNKLLYVAMTRAQDRLYIYGKDTNVMNNLDILLKSKLKLGI